MRSIIFFTGIFLHLSLVAQVQKSTDKTIDPPGEIRASFIKNFPGASKIKWEKEGANYEVNFVQEKKQLSALYNKTGILMETELSISPMDLPEEVRNYVSRHYNKSAITEAARIKKAGGEVSYEAHVNNYDLIFSEQGKFIRKDKN